MHSAWWDLVETCKEQPAGPMLKSMDFNHIDWKSNIEGQLRNCHFQSDKQIGYVIEPDGVTVNVEIPHASLLVLPYCSTLNFEIRDGLKEIESIPILDGAFVGIILPQGDHSLHLKIPFGFSGISLIIHILMMVCIALFIVSLVALHRFRTVRI